MECKVLDGLFSRPLNQRFNRDIVECKDVNSEYAVALTEDLIETLWNVKMNVYRFSKNGKIDLIETLWNVKIVVTWLVSNDDKDLIETLWNVKIEH